MIVPKETRVLIDDTLEYLQRNGLSSRDTFTLKTLLYSIYIDGMEEGLKQAQEILNR